MAIFCATVRRRRVLFRRKAAPDGMIWTDRGRNSFASVRPLTYPNLITGIALRRGKQDKELEMDPVENAAFHEGCTTLGKERNPRTTPKLFTSPPPLRDLLTTKTTVAQDETLKECLPLLTSLDDSSRDLFDLNSRSPLRLEREKHVEFLHNCLRKLPASYVGLDASRPWQVYWALTGLSILGEDVKEYRERVVKTVTPMQNLDGGFGGSHGHASHCAPSYAVILSLAMVGGKEALETIDRRALWKWLGKLKQDDGGFVVCVGGEEDVRGAYCSMVMISLLALPLELPFQAPSRTSGLKLFSDGLPEYLSRCQTFEGGISGAPQTEAHGAYAFCALACLCIIGPPDEMIPEYLDVPILMSWLSARQYAPEGGFAGRTNKLVDGCYSHWVGGCWPLLEASISGPQTTDDLTKLTATGSLFSREGLARYILSCCQAKKGGLRDKPSARADAYHSCYALAGLSSSQYYNYFTKSRQDEAVSSLDFALCWASSADIPKTDEENKMEHIIEAEDVVKPIHPIFVIPWDKVELTHAWFAQKEGF